MSHQQHDDPEILAFFAHAHLPPNLQEVSKKFTLLASDLVATLPDCEQRGVALQKLLEAKDAAVRCLAKPAAKAEPEEPEEPEDEKDDEDEEADPTESEKEPATPPTSSSGPDRGAPGEEG